MTSRLPPITQQEIWQRLLAKHPYPRVSKTDSSIEAITNHEPPVKKTIKEKRRPWKQQWFVATAKQDLGQIEQLLQDERAELDLRALQQVLSNNWRGAEWTQVVTMVTDKLQARGDVQQLTIDRLHEWLWRPMYGEHHHDELVQKIELIEQLFAKQILPEPKRWNRILQREWVQKGNHLAEWLVTRGLWQSPIIGEKLLTPFGLQRLLSLAIESFPQPREFVEKIQLKMPNKLTNLSQRQKNELCEVLWNDESYSQDKLTQTIMALAKAGVQMPLTDYTIHFYSKTPATKAKVGVLARAMFDSCWSMFKVFYQDQTLRDNFAKDLQKISNDLIDRFLSARYFNAMMEAGFDFNKVGPTKQNVFFMMFREPTVQVSPELHQYLSEHWDELEKQTDNKGYNCLTQREKTRIEVKVKLRGKKAMKLEQYQKLVVKDHLVLKIKASQAKPSHQQHL